MKWTSDFGYAAETLTGAEGVEAETVWQHHRPDFPLHQRSIWPSIRGRETWCLLRITPTQRGKPIVCVGLLVNRLRSLPGGIYIRVPKFGVGLNADMTAMALMALAHLAKRWKRVVRLRIEVTQLDRAEDLDLVKERATELGYRVVPPQEYQYTLLSPVPVSIDDAGRQFNRAILKNVRKSTDAGYVVQSVLDERFADRMRELYRETMKRTGAAVPEIDMMAVLRSAKEYPQNFRVSGLFQSGHIEPKTLMAFRWCGISGKFAFDLLAASTRIEERGAAIPMMPAIMLDVFSWAHHNNASLFDFGGVVPEDHQRYAVVGGISRFKLQFGGTVERVGLDLVSEPRPWLANLAKMLPRAASMVGRMKKGPA